MLADCVVVSARMFTPPSGRLTFRALIFLPGLPLCPYNTAPNTPMSLGENNFIEPVWPAGTMLEKFGTAGKPSFNSVTN